MSEEKPKVKKPWYKRWWAIVLGVIVVIGIITNLADGGDDEGSSGANEKATTSETKKDKQSKPATAEPKKEAPKKDSTKPAKKADEPKQVKHAKIGDPLKVGDVVFKVIDKKTASNVGGEFGTDAQGTFLVLTVSVKNEGKKSITTDSSFFKLKSGDTEYEADTEAAIYANDDAEFFLQDVNPGITNKGKVVFDIPKEAANGKLTLNVQTGFWGTEQGQILLK